MLPTNPSWRWPEAPRWPASARRCSRRRRSARAYAQDGDEGPTAALRPCRGRYAAAPAALAYSEVEPDDEPDFAVVPGAADAAVARQEREAVPPGGQCRDRHFRARRCRSGDLLGGQHPPHRRSAAQPGRVGDRADAGAGPPRAAVPGRAASAGGAVGDHSGADPRRSGGPRRSRRLRRARSSSNNRPRRRPLPPHRRRLPRPRPRPRHRCAPPVVAPVVPAPVVVPRLPIIPLAVGAPEPATRRTRPSSSGRRSSRIRGIRRSSRIHRSGTRRSSRDPPWKPPKQDKPPAWDPPRQATTRRPGIRRSSSGRQSGPDGVRARATTAVARVRLRRRPGLQRRRQHAVAVAEAGALTAAPAGHLALACRSVSRRG